MSVSEPAIRVEHSNRASRIGLAIVSCALIALAAAPWWADRANLRLLSEIYAYVALASLWNLLAGYAGLVSVGQHAYVGLGAYVLFGLAMLAGVHPLVAIPIAGFAAADRLGAGGAADVPAARALFRDRHLGDGGGVPAVGRAGLRARRRLRHQPAVGDRALDRRLPRDARVHALLDRAGARRRGARRHRLLLRSRYGLALTAIRDNELGARSNGVDVARVKYLVYVAVAFGTAMVGALVFLQKIRISPDTAFSVNDWTAFVIFITVIGGIGRIEGPIVGTIVFFLLRQTLADLGAIYLLILGAVAIVVMLKAPKGLWGLIADRYGWQLFPLERRLVIEKPP